MKKLILILSTLVSSVGFSGGEETPPELPPRNQSPSTDPSSDTFDDFDTVPPPAQERAVAEEKKKAVEKKPVEKTVIVRERCSATKQYIEGKCICEKPTCKPKTVEKKVYIQTPPKTVYVETPGKTIIKTVEKPVIKYKNVDRVVEKTVERVVEKFIQKHHTLIAFYGRGPDGVAPVLKERRDTRKEYEFYQEYGNVWAIQYIYNFTAFDSVPFHASALFITNDTKMGGLGFSF
jgi:hypothetical protein